MPYVDLSYEDPNADIGNRLRKLDAYSSAGNSLAQGDYDTARNSLMQYGFPDDAQKVQSIHNSADANSRSNAAEGRTVSDRELAQTIGEQYAGGDTTGAKNAAIAAGKLDLANDYGTYEGNNANRAQDQAKRAAMADAAQMTAAGNVAGARARLQPFYSSPEAFMQDLTASQKAVADKAGSLALLYKDDPEGWSREALPMFHTMGLNPQGYEGAAGLNRALAESGQGATVFKADAAQEKAATTGAKGVAANRFNDTLAAFKDTYGVEPTPQQRAILIADKTKYPDITTDENGQPKFFVNSISNPVQGAARIAEAQLENNVKFNQEHAQDIKSGLVQAKSDQIGDVYKDMRGQPIQQQNANTRAAMANPENRGAIAGAVARESKLSQDEVARAGRDANLTQIRSHIADAVEDADNPISDHIFGRLSQGHAVRAIRESLTPDTVGAALARRNVLSDVETIREETQRFFHIAGQGALTDTDKARIDNLLVDLERSPNREVFKGQLQHLDRTLSRIVAGATARGVMNQPQIKAAQDQSAKALGDSVGQATQPGNPAPGATPAQVIRKFNLSTGKIE